MTVSCALPRVSAKFASVTRVSFPSADIGNKEFANHIGIKLPTLRRITNTRDPITFLPGEVRVFNHPGSEGTLTHGFSAMVCGEYHIGTHSCVGHFAAQQDDRG